MRGKSIDYFENSRRATYVQQQYAIRNPGQFAVMARTAGGSRPATAPVPRASSRQGAAILRLHGAGCARRSR